jgi:putative RNA 2'-phosphotransferase
MARHRPKQLAKLLHYILGRRPDEFGLVANPDGTVSIKELQQAIREEEGWSSIRLADIQETLQLRPKQKPVIPPEILFHAARLRAYPHILEKGLFPTRHPYVHLASQESLALRMGRRRDPNPVLIKIHAVQARKEGTRFFSAGDLIYLAESVSPEYLEGPPLPREKPPQIKAPEKPVYRPPGSFEIDLRTIPKRLRKEKEKRSEVWKKESRRYRRERKT